MAGCEICSARCQNKLLGGVITVDRPLSALSALSSHNLIEKRLTNLPTFVCVSLITQTSKLLFQLSISTLLLLTSLCMGAVVL